MDDDELKAAGWGCLILIVVGAAVILVLNATGLIWDRAASKYTEETRKQVYDTSRQYEQGTNRDIARYCEQMRSADSAASRKAVAALIRSTASTFDGHLTDDNTACIAEAKGN